MSIIARYFDAFNAGDVDGMLACLTEDVAHHVNEGQVRRGRADFAAFCQHMSRCYAEELRDMVIFEHTAGTRAAAEYTVHGTYLATDGDLPAAHGQRYTLPAGSFFTLQGGQISRVTTYYNLADWLKQVSA
ncbi:MAG: ketosteroid isomerase-related protein [Pseudomonadota bacterium]